MIVVVLAAVSSSSWSFLLCVIAELSQGGAEYQHETQQQFKAAPRTKKRWRRRVSCYVGGRRRHGRS